MESGNLKLGTLNMTVSELCRFTADGYSGRRSAHCLRGVRAGDGTGEQGPRESLGKAGGTNSTPAGHFGRKRRMQVM